MSFIRLNLSNAQRFDDIGPLITNERPYEPLPLLGTDAFSDDSDETSVESTVGDGRDTGVAVVEGTAMGILERYPENQPLVVDEIALVFRASATSAQGLGSVPLVVGHWRQRWIAQGGVEVDQGLDHTGSLVRWTRRANTPVQISTGGEIRDYRLTLTDEILNYSGWSPVPEGLGEVLAELQVMVSQISFTAIGQGNGYPVQDSVRIHQAYLEIVAGRIDAEYLGDQHAFLGY